ncbi:type II toxin-antitoxin system RelE/ParE family toxin [Cupriavidus pauculus]|uniref:Plasmid maintenance system killer n=1 Tax=Cupriavidus pauculus TaxID=82633 RepID=A0A2N5CBZ4_9BURK|nr:type II toxin-antitoxin system RelE/ParE family toxin [Cupriavidus pauculus]PLP99749.1 plasmid maintenance system killer [Cupriavidus pauculus]
MIRSLANKSTAALFCGHSVHTLPLDIQTGTMRKLAMLDAAVSPPDLAAAPANELEPMRGRRRGQWRVRIEGDWHLCFRFLNGEAWDVEVVQCPADEEQA